MVKNTAWSIKVSKRTLFVLDANLRLTPGIKELQRTSRLVYKPKNILETFSYVYRPYSFSLIVIYIYIHTYI
jgi:hypothetical protein